MLDYLANDYDNKILLIPIIIDDNKKIDAKNSLLASTTHTNTRLIFFFVSNFISSLLTFRGVRV